MEILLYTIVFLLLLVVSNVTNRLLPQLPLPLVQIVLGISLGFLLPQGKFHLDTELFLALVIGPLLFREAEESNITSILKHWRIILFFQLSLFQRLVWAIWLIFSGLLCPWRPALP